MPSFVHIADERNAASILRTGLKLRKVPATSFEEERPVGIFALPVVPNFLLSHQWVRELKRRGYRTAIGVYFKLPASEEVWAGLYNQPKRRMTAAQATSELRGMHEFGFEVIIPRGISPKGIMYTRVLPQNLGWRYFPDAHKRGIFCGCEYCMRGEIRSRRIRERYEAGEL